MHRMNTVVGKFFLHIAFVCRFNNAPEQIGQNISIFAQGPSQHIVNASHARGGLVILPAGIHDICDMLVLSSGNVCVCLLEIAVLIN